MPKKTDGASPTKGRFAQTSRRFAQTSRRFAQSSRRALAMTSLARFLGRSAAVASATFVFLLAPLVAIAQNPTAVPAAAGAAGEASLNYSFIDLIKFGGVVGYVIIFLSIIALSLIIQYALSIRASRLIPEADKKALIEAVAAGRYDDIATLASDKGSSYLARVVAGGVREQDRGYDAVVKGMEDSADTATGVLLRHLEHLNIIANIAPMLGLLGTVIGMVNSFNQISIAVGGVDPRRLASGIFEALMTTVMGLIVAIPALYMFGIFRNRVDALAAEAAGIAEDIVEPLKRPRG
ncbi:MAG: biopolymer transport protein ExbB [Hyphomicrobiaceae bacterium]|jgi:biopolymer transport protein ExbB